MAESARPPVAVRISRPYDTEEAFLENELETVGKTSVILIGAHSRPTGVVLRFEVALATGTVILRGEGRVLAYKETAFRGQAGLALRFTRLDPKSKAFVDRAVAMREPRLAGDQRAAPPPSSGQIAPPPSSSPMLEPSGPVSVAPAAPPPAPSSEPILAQALTAPTPPPPPMAPEPVAEAAPPASDPVPVPASDPVPVLASDPVPVPDSSPASPAAAAPAPAAPKSGDREALLARLRQRAAGLTPEKKAQILGS